MFHSFPCEQIPFFSFAVRHVVRDEVRCRICGCGVSGGVFALLSTCFGIPKRLVGSGQNGVNARINAVL